MRRRRIPDRRRDRLAPVRQDAQIRHLRPGPPAQQREQHPVAVPSLRRAWRRARLHELVPGREQRHANRAANVHGLPPERRGQGEVLRPQHPARGQGDRAGGHVLAGRAGVRPDAQSVRQGEQAIGFPHVFLHEHRIRAGRQRRSGEDSHRRPARERRRHGSGSDAAPQRDGPALQTGQTDRIAVHGRIREGGQIDLGHQIMRQNAPVGLKQRHGFRPGNARDPLGDHGQRRIHALQLAAEREAVVRELRHQGQSSAWSSASRATASTSSSATDGSGASTTGSAAIATTVASLR